MFRHTRSHRLLPILFAVFGLSALSLSAQTNHWEPEIRAFENRDRTNPPPQNAILFVGSSAIRKWTTLARDFPGLDVINRGFGGSQIEDSTFFADRIIFPYHPRIIVLYAGDNDLAAGKTPDQVVAEFADFVKTVRVKMPETPIVYISIKASTARWKLKDKIMETNRRIAAMGGNGLAFADVFSRMLGADGKPRKELLQSDGLHPTEQGYRIWASLIRPVLDAGGKPGPRIMENFDAGWRFHLGDAANASAQEFSDGDWREVELPHDFSREGEFSETNASCTAYLPGGIAWYRKSFFVPLEWSNKVVSLRFDGVSMRSRVWINGHELGGRPYAFSTFDDDLTRWLKFGGTNAAAVRIDRPNVDDLRWYPGSGIYRHVWMEATEKVHIARNGVYITTPHIEIPKAGRDKAEVDIQTRIQNGMSDASMAHVTTRIFDPAWAEVETQEHDLNIKAGKKRGLSETIQVLDPKIWRPDSPALYTAVTEVRAGGELVDRLETRFGIRTIRFDARGGFYLNDEPLKIKGVCLHDDAGALGVAVPEKVLERRLRLLKQIGCNAIRCSHNPKAPEFYDLCDRLGLLVMDEAFDEWTGAKNKWIVGRNAGAATRSPGYSEFFKEWAGRDLSDMVLRDRNHPSVILWSIGNEIDYPGDPFSYPTDKDYDSDKPSAKILPKIAPRLIADVRAHDRSRPVTQALANLPASDATGLAGLLDVVGCNYQFSRLTNDLVRYPRRKFVISECGFGLDFSDLCETNPRVAGQFLWTGFDYLGEAGEWPNHGSRSGLFDTCGFEKARGYFRESLWSAKPMVYVAIRSGEADDGASTGQWTYGRHASESHWNWQDDPRAELPVEVYSNCKTVELFLNGRSLGKKDADDAPYHIRGWPVHFEPGELKAVGTDGNKTVEYRLVTAGKPARMKLAADQTSLVANGEDAANIVIRVEDHDGNLVPGDEAMCSIQVTGQGRLLALDNGDQNDPTPLTSPARKLHNSRALAVVRSLRESGKITIKASVPGLPEAQFVLQSD